MGFFVDCGVGVGVAAAVGAVSLPVFVFVVGFGVFVSLGFPVGEGTNSSPGFGFLPHTTSGAAR